MRVASIVIVSLLALLGGLAAGATPASDGESGTVFVYQPHETIQYHLSMQENVDRSFKDTSRTNHWMIQHTQASLKMAMIMEVTAQPDGEKLSLQIAYPDISVEADVPPGRPSVLHVGRGTTGEYRVDGIPSVLPQVLRDLPDVSFRASIDRHGKVRKVADNGAIKLWSQAGIGNAVQPWRLVQIVFPENAITKDDEWHYEIPLRLSDVDRDLDIAITSRVQRVVTQEDGHRLLEISLSGGRTFRNVLLPSNRRMGAAFEKLTTQIENMVITTEGNFQCDATTGTVVQGHLRLKMVGSISTTGRLGPSKERALPVNWKQSISPYIFSLSLEPHEHK